MGDFFFFFGTSLVWGRGFPGKAPGACCRMGNGGLNLERGPQGPFIGHFRGGLALELAGKKNVFGGKTMGRVCGG